MEAVELEVIDSLSAVAQSEWDAPPQWHKPQGAIRLATHVERTAGPRRAGDAMFDGGWIMFADAGEQPDTR